jgi:hypothetical protein
LHQRNLHFTHAAPFDHQTNLRLSTGLPLAPLIADDRNFGTLLKVVKQYFILLHILPNLQLALNLTGESADPLMVTWDVIRKQGILNNTGMAMDRVPKAGILLNYIQIFNALILGELEVAEQSVQRILSLKLQRLNGNHFSNYFFPYATGFWDSCCRSSEASQSTRHLRSRP